jgi:hypothetical protein
VYERQEASEQLEPWQLLERETAEKEVRLYCHCNRYTRRNQRVCVCAGVAERGILSPIEEELGVWLHHFPPGCFCLTIYHMHVSECMDIRLDT